MLWGMAGDVRLPALPLATQITKRPDARLAEVAGEQWGVVSRGQVLGCGLNTSSITARVQDGRLHRLYPGVYAVVAPGALRTEGRRVAAVMACGPGAVLSHRSAAEFWGLRPDRGRSWTVSVPGQRGRAIAGIHVHRIALAAADVVLRDGIWVTTPARTLLDLAEVVPARDLPRALERAEELGLFDLRAIDAALARAPGRRGRAPLGRALELYRPGTLTRSELERLALGVVAAAGLPAPTPNPQLDDGEVDLLWAAERVVVEIDSARYHASRGAFERDRRKATELTASGYRVLRITDRQLTGEPGWVADRIGRLLAAAA